MRKQVARLKVELGRRQEEFAQLQEEHLELQASAPRCAALRTAAPGARAACMGASAEAFDAPSVGAVRFGVVSLLQRVASEVAQHSEQAGPCPGSRCQLLAGIPPEAFVIPGAGPLFGSQLEHLRPGLSLLHLESITAAEAAHARSMTLAEAAAEMELLVHCNAHHTQQLRGSKRGARRGAAAACEAARRGLHDAGRGVSRLLLSLMLAQPELYWALASRNHRSGQECVGEADAPQALCDGVVGRLGLAREQALLLLDNARLLHARLMRLGRQRLVISAQLGRAAEAGAAAAAHRRCGAAAAACLGSAPLVLLPPKNRGDCSTASEASSRTAACAAPAHAAWPAAAWPATAPAPASSPSLSWPGANGACSAYTAASARMALPAAPAWAPPQAGQHAGWGAATEDTGASAAAAVAAAAAAAVAAAQPPGLAQLATEELVQLLAVNTRCQREVMLLHAQVELAVLTDEQRALLLIGVHPFPFNGGALAHAIDYHLLASLDASFPWAGAPQRMTMARWRLNRRGAGAPPSHTADSQGYVTA